MLPDDLPNPVHTAERTRRAVVIDDPRRIELDYPDLFSLVTRIPPAALSLPLILGERVLGVCSMSWDRPRGFEAADLEMFEAAASQLAAALERARLFEAERAARAELAASIRAATETSRALQRSLLPRRLPSLSGMRVAVRYQASNFDAEGGGDWYDIVRTEHGCVLVIGDVQGHNLVAAALMGQLRTGLHAYLAEGHPVELAVARANDLMMQLTDELIATCCVVEIDTAARRTRIVCAGHPSPLCSSHDGGPLSVPGQPGLPLGAVAGATWTATTLPLGAGDRIVLFTDGLVERRRADIYQGIENLRAVLGEVSDQPGEAAAAAVIQRLGTDAKDDIALLVCDIDDGRDRNGSRTITIEGTPQHISVVRREARALLKAWNMTGVDYAATLIVSELVTNVLRHTGAPGRLQLQPLTDAVRITVTDVEDRLPELDLRPARTATGGRGLMLVQSLASRWGIERHAVGKTIWVEIDVPQAPAAAERAVGQSNTA